MKEGSSRMTRMVWAIPGRGDESDWKEIHEVVRVPETEKGDLDHGMRLNMGRTRSVYGKMRRSRVEEGLSRAWGFLIEEEKVVKLQ